jgi:DNA mismatch repair protein MutL
MTEPPRTASRPNIRPLPERLINKIAAGEVVERPSAVVKELVENALDAGATRIDVIIEKSGSKLIKIVDNGWGIPEDQIEIAFSRHATSKISGLSDLERLLSYGFRGEALPSIASVSRTRMVSRTPESDHATEIVIEGGVVQSKKPVAAPVGTTIEVENLFFNTPARRKFMKAETTEARYLSRIAMAMALVRHDVGFSYTLNSRTIFNVPAGSLGTRASELLGYGKKMVEVAGDGGVIKVHGYVGAPDQAQNNRWGHFIFINGRYIYSISLTHALMAGYGELLPKGLYPIGALLLTVDPAEVDVNVHPAKTEVRLSHEREIHDAIVHIVRDSLRQDGIIPMFKSAPSSPSATSSGGGQDGFSMFPKPPHSQMGIPGVFSRTPVNHEQMQDLYRSPEHSASTESFLVDKSTGEIIGEGSVSSSEPSASQSPGPSEGIRLVGRFSDLYLLLQAGDDLYIVDQHTAHERVLFEETVRRIDSHASLAQQLLFPVQVELNPEQLAVFTEAAELLNQSGFIISPFGGRMVNIEAVPTILTRRSPEKVLRKVIDDISTLKAGGYDLKKAMAQSIACRAAVMSGDRLTDEEAIGLLEQLLRCENKYSCPHGRPTFVRLSRNDLDRQFGRC